MVRKCLIWLVLMACCCVANAQEPKIGGTLDGITVKNSLRERPQTRAYAQEVFTYWSGENIGMLGAGTTDYNIAILVPAEKAGKRVEEIAIPIIDASVLTDVRVWVAEQLPQNVDTDCSVLVEVSNPSSIVVDGSLTLVSLPEPYVIPESGCYVGYSFTVTNAQTDYGYYPIATDGEADLQGGLYLDFGYGWDDCYGQGYGNSCVQVLISGDDYPENAATVESEFATVFAALNGTTNATINVTGQGANPVQSVSYTVRDVATGTVSEEQTVQTGELAIGNSTALTIPLSAEATVGTYAKEITITKVNGEANEATSNVTATGNLLVLSRLVPRKTVMEEFTATGCWYCTRGIAGMNALQDTYPDTFIGIAVHGSMNYPDPMQIAEYPDFLGTYLGGYPSCLLNRSISSADPYFGTSGNMLGILDDVAGLQGAAEAEVVVNPVWNEDSTVISVTTDVTFLTNYDEANYRLAYVLVEDGLSGANDNSVYSYGWWQANSYLGATGADNEPYIYEWTQRGETASPGGSSQLTGPYVKDVVFDHVAIMTQEIADGIEGSISAPIVMEETQTHQTEFDITNGVMPYYSQYFGDLVQNKNNLKVVALLLNTETGEIVNADEKGITTDGTSGINNAVTGDGEAAEVARYTLDGKQISAPVKGINVIKMSDGTTKKVLVK